VYYNNLTIEVVGPDHPKTKPHGYRFFVEAYASDRYATHPEAKYGSPHAAFCTEAGLRRWMAQRGLTVDGNLAEGYYTITGRYREVAVKDRSEVQHHPQILMLQNSDLIRAYREVKPDEVVIYFVSGNLEAFHFRPGTAALDRYLQIRNAG